MTFDAIMAQIIDLLQREHRVSYRALQVRFQLDDALLEAVKDELIYAKKLAVDEDTRVLVWVGDAGAAPSPAPATPQTASPAAPAQDQERDPLAYTPPHLAEQILTSRSALEGERKQVTVLFCDLANSTAIAERIGPEPMHTLLNHFFALALREVHRYEGTINQFLGDGFMALFGAPISHEDHARRAVLAAFGCQRALKEADLGKSYNVACAFRMGLNSGLVVVGSIGDNLRMDYSAIGDTTNLAARLQQLAEPETILVSESTTRLVQGSVRLEALEPVEVKGKTEPITPYKVIGTRPRRSPIASRGEQLLSQFVGRERELAVLHELLKQVETGQGQVVGIVAEAGGGKSRLLYEFQQRLARQPITYLEGRCLSYGRNIPYHPLLDVLRNHCDITETDGPDSIDAKVRCALHEVGMDPAASAPYLLQLLGVKEGAESIAVLTPEAVRTKTFETLRRMFLAGSQQRALICAIEDLHWVDQTSEQYLTSLVESVAGAAILLLTTYRPGYQPPWLAHSYATQVVLHSLSPPQALTIVHSTSQRARLAAQIAQTIVDKAEGNPFFLEELTRAVIEQDNLQAAMTVPDTVQGVLMARVDRLPEESKRLLQTAAVLGREFTPRLLEAIWEGPGVLASLLQQLQRLEFLYAHPEAEEPSYVFTHALTQEVVYDSLLTTRRQALHAAAGHAIERLYQDGLVERAEELAHHFTLGAVWDKAFHYLTRLGEKARQAYANQEATAFYTQAIAVSEQITPALEAGQILPVYEGRGLVWTQQTRYDEAIADFQHMCELARAMGNQRKEGASLSHLAYTHFLKFSADQMPLVVQYSREALRLAQDLNDHTILVHSLTTLASVEQNDGKLQDAEQKFRTAIQLSRQEGLLDALPPALRLLSAQTYWQGNFQPAIRLSQEGADVARDLSDGFHELFCLAFLCQSRWSCGDYQDALMTLQEVVTKAHERHNPFFLGRMRNTLGWFHRDLGDAVHAVEYDQESVDMGRTAHTPHVELSALVNLGLDYLALGQYAHASTFLTSTLDRVEHEAFGSHRWQWKMKLFIGLAELSYATEDYAQALRYVEEGLQEAQATHAQKYMALGWALRGKIAAKLGDPDTAGTELQRAFALAEQLQSPSLIYPMAHDLGQWHASSGQEREAVSCYGKAKAIIAQMATAVGDETLRAAFLQSALVQEIRARAARLGE